MDDITRTHLNNLNLSKADDELRYQAYLALMEATEQPVEWAYDVWDDMVVMLSKGDNHQRAIAAQLLANLARSDPQKRMLRDFAALLAVTRDERFVTARYCMQSIWKVGVAGKEQQKLVVDGLALRFHECSNEKNCTLIRYDISQSLRNLYDAVKDESIRSTALELIATEPDSKYRAKYATLWKR